MRNNICAICIIAVIVILFFYGLSIRSLELKVQRIEEDIVENNLWGSLEQVQNATIETLKQVNRVLNDEALHEHFMILEKGGEVK